MFFSVIIFLNFLLWVNKMKEFNAGAFREYLEWLDNHIPFSCPNLRVLPETVYAEGEHDVVYEEGSLVCIKGPTTAGKLEFRCCSPLVISGGKVKVLCKRDDGKSRFELDI